MKDIYGDTPKEVDIFENLDLRPPYWRSIISQASVRWPTRALVKSSRTISIKSIKHKGSVPDRRLDCLKAILTPKLLAENSIIFAS